MCKKREELDVTQPVSILVLPGKEKEERREILDLQLRVGDMPFEIVKVSVKVR